jgi:hypothetical protein
MNIPCKSKEPFATCLYLMSDEMDESTMAVRVFEELASEDPKGIY